MDFTFHIFIKKIFLRKCNREIYMVGAALRKIPPIELFRLFVQMHDTKSLAHLAFVVSGSMDLQ